MVERGIGCTNLNFEQKLSKVLLPNMYINKMSVCKTVTPPPPPTPTLIQEVAQFIN